MNFEEAKHLMLVEYSKIASNVEEQAAQLLVTFDENSYIVTEEDIYVYAEQYPSFASLSIVPSNCGVCSKDYREQLVVPIDPNNAYIRGSTFPEDITFGEIGISLYLQIGSATVLYKNRMRFEESYLEQSLRRGRMPTWRPRGELFSEQDIRRLHFSPTTIRVHNLGTSSIENAIKISTPLIESCLFELSYLKGLSLALSDDWPNRHPRIPPYRSRDLYRGNQLPLPRTKYNKDVVRFYQRGISSRDPIIRFLSLYQVLEYYFLQVSDEYLYSRLAFRLNDPAFSVKPRFLDRVIQDVISHKRVTDETEMLKLVLEKFVPADGLIEFIQDYETDLGESLYTKRRNLFGEEIPETRLQEGHIHSNLARRIKVIRNAIVHSSDRYERRERYIPLTSQSEEIISREIPLLRFLAENIIIGTAST